MGDDTLLQEYGEDGCEEAFRILVEKYTGMVFSSALRRTGNHEIAEEITQRVFAILARKANHLKVEVVLAGWLHKTTRLEAAKAMRGEYTRIRKMAELSELQQLRQGGTEFRWEDAMPHLDNAMDELRESDRNVVLLRYFEKKGFREIGKLTGKNAGAAQKQTRRAVEKLRLILQNKGIVMSATALAAGMSATLGKAAPIGLSQTVFSSALAGAPSITTTTAITNTIQTMAYTKLKMAAVVAFVAAIPIGLQWNKIHALEKQLSAWNKDDEGFELLRDENRRLESLLAHNDGIGSPPVDRSLNLEDVLPRVGGKLNMKRLINDYRAMFGRKEQTKMARTAAAMESLTTEELKLVLEELEDPLHKGQGASYLTELVIANLAGREPAFASNYALEKNLRIPLQASLRQWGRNNPEAALAWFEEMDSQNALDNKSLYLNVARRDLYLGCLITGIAQRDLQQAMRLWQEIELDNDPSKASVQTTSDRVIYDLTEGIRDERQQHQFFTILDNLQDGAKKEQALSAYTRQLADHEGAHTAIQFLADRDQADDFHRKLMRNVVGRGIEANLQDVGEIADIYLSNSSDFQQAEDARDLISRWAQHDFNAAGQWLSELDEAAPFRNAAIGKFAATVVRADQRTAFDWARVITDDQERRKAMASVYQYWLKKNSAEAADYVADLGIDASELTPADGH